MSVDAREFEKRLQNFEQACRDAGIKLTHQRIEIFREVAQSESHPDAESVHQGVRMRLPTVSLDTVYRTLWMLNDLGLIKTLGPSRESTRFDANLAQHHHFVCVRCGLTRDFYSDFLAKLDIGDAISDIGKISSTHIEIHGICHECAKKDEK